MEGNSHAKNQLDSSSRFSRTPTCDGHTDGRTRHREVKRSNIGPREQRRTIVQRLQLSGAKNLDEMRQEFIQTETPKAGWVGQRISTNPFLYLETGARL